MHNISDVRHIEIHTAEALVPDPSPFEVGIDIQKLKKYKLPGTDQTRAELIQAGGETLMFEIHKLIHSIWIKDQWKSPLLYQFTRKVIKLTAVIIKGYHCYHLHIILSDILLSKLNLYISEIIGDLQCGF
jgi:hypothetical protein